MEETEEFVIIGFGYLAGSGNVEFAEEYDRDVKSFPLYAKKEDLNEEDY